MLCVGMLVAAINSVVQIAHLSQASTGRAAFVAVAIIVSACSGYACITQLLMRKWKCTPIDTTAMRGTSTLLLPNISGSGQGEILVHVALQPNRVDIGACIVRIAFRVDSSVKGQLPLMLRLTNAYPGECVAFRVQQCGRWNATLEIVNESLTGMDVTITLRGKTELIKHGSTVVTA